MTGTSITYTSVTGGERVSTTCMFPCDNRCALNTIANIDPEGVTFIDEEKVRKGCMMTDTHAIKGTVCNNRVAGMIPKKSKLRQIFNILRG